MPVITSGWRFTKTKPGRPVPQVCSKKSGSKVIRVGKGRSDSSSVDKWDISQSQSYESVATDESAVKRMPSGHKSQRDRVFSRMISRASSSFGGSAAESEFSETTVFGRRKVSADSPQDYHETTKNTHLTACSGRDRVLKRMLNRSTLRDCRR
mmetsp:Transcript_20867/g.30025  ORF Transcript_20867/g.30025 Transcript_20867/m.30025 type:complete len:153 (-) Transcript_20867:192-650(-)